MTGYIQLSPEQMDVLNMLEVMVLLEDSEALIYMVGMLQQAKGVSSSKGWLVVSRFGVFVLPME